MDKNNKKYPPNDRTFLRPDSAELKSYSKNGTDSVKLPNPVIDDIVVNNISWSEFDYIHVPGEDDDDF